MRGSAVDEWVRWMKSAGTPENTIRLRRYYIHRLASEAHLTRGAVVVDLTLEDLERWMAQQTWAPNTRKSARSALRSFYGYARDRGLITTSPAHLLPAVKIPRGKPKPTPEPVYRQAMARADERVRRAIMLAAQCGLRRAEIAAAHTDHLEADELGPVLRVAGKGGHTRIVPLPPELARELRTLEPGWLFPSPLGGHLTPHHLAKLITAELGHGSTHGLRHRAATRAYAATRDLRAVQELLGHSRPETTARYVAVADDAVRAAMMAAAA